jgi:proteic killer suppression protein
MSVFHAAPHPLITLGVNNALRYHADMIEEMIRSFADKKTEKIFRGRRTRGLNAGLQRMARRRMLILDAADRLNDLLIPPGNRLEKLGGKLAGQYSVRINERWRICFRWRRGDAYEVKIVDYH